MRFMACAAGASLGISETEFFSPTFSNAGIADFQSQLTDASVTTRIIATQATMMRDENLRTVRAMNGGRGCSVLMRPSLVPQQQRPHQRART
jgi:hypothetical protein